MLTVLTQNSRFRRSAGCISSEWRRKGEFSLGWVGAGFRLGPKSSVGSQPMRTIGIGLEVSKLNDPREARPMASRGARRALLGQATTVDQYRSRR
jgi:hypothetical protein